MAWHDTDTFWEVLEGALFPPDRLARAGEEVDRLVALLGLSPPARVLDLCTGPGRHAIELAKRGFRVTGVDRTRRYLERAESAAAAASVEVEWVEADAREFDRPGEFDAALNLFTSFGYFEEDAENQKMADNLRRSLRPGGKLLMEMLGKENLVRHYRNRFWHEVPEGFLLEDPQIRSGFAHIDNHWIFLSRGQTHRFTVSHRLYSGQELKEILQRAGFAPITLYGDLAGSPYDLKATRLVAVAQVA